jgi:hypothetical protein
MGTIVPGRPPLLPSRTHTQSHNHHHTIQHPIKWWHKFFSMREHSECKRRRRLSAVCNAIAPCLIYVIFLLPEGTFDRIYV